MYIILYLTAAFVVVMALAMHRRWECKRSRQAISVIVVARNEHELLPHCLASLAQIDYPENLFEVVLVDDASTDDTFTIMRDWCRTYPNRHCYRIDQKDPLLPGKKAALTLGAMQAKYSIIAQTDADCAVSKNWLDGISTCFGPHVGMVVGLFEIDHLPFIDRLKRLVSSGLFASTIGVGYPFTASGANLAITKEAFNQASGYVGAYKFAFGDDKSLLNRIRDAGFKVAIQATAKVKELRDERSRFWIRNRRHFGKFALSSFPYQVLTILMGIVFVLWPIAFCHASGRPAAWTLLASMYLFYFSSALRSRSRIRFTEMLALPLYPYFVFVMTILGSFGNIRWR